MRSRVLTCASPAYIARHGTPSHPDDLASGHQCVLLRDPHSGSPFGWEFHRDGKIIPVTASGRLMVNDTAALLGVCLGGQGIAQPLAVYVDDMLRDGRLVQVLPDWSDETFPLYVYHRSRHLMSAKVRVFLEFVTELAKGRP